MKIRIFKILLFIFLLISFVFTNASSYANTVSKELYESFFRLHILANSDSAEDQNLKLLVRDDVLKYINEITSDCTNKQESIKVVSNNLEVIQKIAQETIFKNGYNYKVNVEIGIFCFPTKYYGNISMPAGFYDALRIKIGNAKGHNWWCSIYPSLCFTDVSNGVVSNNTKENLENSLSKETFDLIFYNKKNIQVKFKIVELFEILRK